MAQTVRKEVIIQNNAGMHLRPAAAFVRTANKYKNCDVRIIRDNQSANGKSIMGLVMLAATKGTKLTIECTGEDCEKALEELCDLVENHFGMDT